MNGDFREDLKKACEVMQKGVVILYPTDTIWGIGCDATNPKAVKRVYDIKSVLIVRRCLYWWTVR